MSHPLIVEAFYAKWKLSKVNRVPYINLLDYNVAVMQDKRSSRWKWRLVYKDRVEYSSASYGDMLSAKREVLNELERQVLKRV